MRVSLSLLPVKVYICSESYKSAPCPPQQQEMLVVSVWDAGPVLSPPISMDMSLSKLLETVRDREVWHAAVQRATKSQTHLSD